MWDAMLQTVGDLLEALLFLALGLIPVFAETTLSDRVERFSTTGAKTRNPPKMSLYDTQRCFLPKWRAIRSWVQPQSQKRRAIS